MYSIGLLCIQYIQYIYSIYIMYSIEVFFCFGVTFIDIGF